VAGKPMQAWIAGEFGANIYNKIVGLLAGTPH
jgi:hypothetical protein